MDIKQRRVCAVRGEHEKKVVGNTLRPCKWTQRGHEEWRGWRCMIIRSQSVITKAAVERGLRWHAWQSSPQETRLYTVVIYNLYTLARARAKKTFHAVF